MELKKDSQMDTLRDRMMVQRMGVHWALLMAQKKAMSLEQMEQK